VISKKLSDILAWKWWDQWPARELADWIRSDIATAKNPAAGLTNVSATGLRSSGTADYERIAPLDDCPFVDAARRVAIMQKVSDRIAREGSAPVRGRGAPGFFQNRNHALLYFFMPHARREFDA
jgi:hypothetical protein